MRSQVNLTLFAHVCARPEAELDLAEAALLIAEAEYPGLDVASYIQRLDELGRGAKAAIAHPRPPAASEEEVHVERVLRYLFECTGFRGNSDDYYDPRNSFLSDVLDRRVGIPLSLAIVFTEVCRRAGVNARGVSFPGHFLVRVDIPRGTILIDPFVGRSLGGEDLRALHARATGHAGTPSPRLLEPAPKVQILLRMLNNLRSIYEARSDHERLRGVLERVYVLAPGQALRQQLETLGGSEPWRLGGTGLN